MVRWAAAKGVGRLTERLPQIAGDDVLDAILGLFEDPEKENNWHGACLTLAELARRGLLLPGRLEEVIPLVVTAIHVRTICCRKPYPKEFNPILHVLCAYQYDVPRRQTSVGAHVRDSACYTFWAISRAYSPEVLKPFVKSIAQAIVTAFLFDREVNCRRAASAAFQELVGRQRATVSLYMA